VTPKYRADIDGLRAVAVLSVIFYHSGYTIFSGGYVGVDIFFVISGYLITTIIVREIANKEFSIARFYERRFRRIFPALTLVIAVSLLAGFIMLTPSSLIDLAQSTISTVLFSSNILFFFESGYFDGAAEMKPLLHTWSLAIEEQYYIFFPIILIIIAKIDSKHYFKWLLILSGVSFILCLIYTRIDSQAAFYLIPTRAWELLIGSIIALRSLPVPRSLYARELTSILGLIFIVYSIFQYTPETKFPGMAASLPVIGAALIIWSGSNGTTLVSRILSLRPIVFIGLISYSLYLWHWPVIVFTKIYSIKNISEMTTIVMLGAIFILSVLSWKYVETPFRKKALLGDGRSIMWASLMVSLTLFFSGCVFINKEGFPLRQTSHANLDLDISDGEWERYGKCENVVDRIKNSQELCTIGKSISNVSFILWGDSHGRALASGVNLSAVNQSVKGIVVTKSACPPLLSIERPNRKVCDEFNQKVLRVISDRPEIGTVILAARWALSATGMRYKQESGEAVKLIDVEFPNNNVSNVKLFETGLTRTIKELLRLKKKVFLVNTIPEIGFDVPQVNFIAELSGRDINKLIAPQISEYEERTKEVIKVFNLIKKDMPVKIVKPDDYLCENGFCKVVANGALLYRDDDHLSTFGSKYISKTFDPIFKSMVSNAAVINK